jgi:transcriptional regulator with XRE-family HTH domain
MGVMSTPQRYERIPELTLGWRLQMALGEMSAQEMADTLGVSRQTLSRWMHDVGSRPKRAYLSQWALATGVPIEWIEHGKVSDSPPRPDPSVKRSAEGHGVDDVPAVRRTRKYSLTALAPVA